MVKVMSDYQLKDREKAILRFVIHQFILTANPVGSRNISKKYNIGLSPATIRNIMADLEELGYLDHPHTSAGRVPTDKGYRVYVDSLMEPPYLDRKTKEVIDANLNAHPSYETDDLLKITTSILSNLTDQLAMVTYPKIEQAKLERIQIVRLSSTRILVVVTIQSGLIRTITLELDAEIEEENIETVQLFLNERLSGLKFSEIRSTIAERIKDIDETKYKPIVRVFLDSVDRIFTDISSDKVVVKGAKNILKQPEFADHEQFQSVIELIENKDIIIHVLDKKRQTQKDDLVISIGKENQDEKLSEYSMITKEYKIGDLEGTVGIMGPKRMNYSKIIAAVVYIANQLTEELTKQR
ncbi:heat-inducible transcription repressor HrcA [Melioribacter roseus P3M-2]|uniref:Heat-inducible transcription repressor HrcA n=2 Tax=Melioribacteraceae TaxID=1334117 RepID=I6ZRJ5_MELRP|nr:heat-inducible transcription repressor HrcA [Melioribacter roseus P3M-2]